MSAAERELDLLVVVAHPDDEALCAAGTLALCAERGLRTGVICATRGELGPIADPSLAERSTLGQVRERELRRSCAVLGVQHIELLDLPDGGVEWAASERTVAEHVALLALVARIRALRPRVLIGFGPDGLYGHRDHVAIGQLLSDARRLSANAAVEVQGSRPHWVERHFLAVWTGHQVRKLLDALATAGTPGQLWGLRSEDFVVAEAEVTARVDVTSVLGRKLNALRCHETQLAPDHAFRLIRPDVAARVLAEESFRCADGLPGEVL